MPVGSNCAETDELIQRKLVRMDNESRHAASCRIRSGVAGDLPAVYQLVCALAAYEKSSAAVATLLIDYQRDFAAEQFELLVAEDASDGVIGLMLFYPAYSTWKGRMLYLEDFVVDEAYRHQGIGLQLWASFVSLAHSRDCTMIKWQVLDWNEPARAFYRKVGAELESGWENGKLIF